MLEASVGRMTKTAIKPVPLGTAIAAVKHIVQATYGSESIATADAHKRVIAYDLLAPVDLPLRDSSAVDGYAVRSVDLGQLPAILGIDGEAAAGHPFDGVVGPGSAVRILTGGAIPRGADRVVMQEHCRLDSGRVVVGETGKRNIRRQGEDVKQGTVVLRAGRRLRVEDLALAHALGLPTIQVRRQLRVGLLSTGDEVAEPGSPLGPGQIWDANRSLLKGLLSSLGCQVIDLGIVGDHAERIESALRAAAPDCDLIVTSGGMSVGNGDYMRSIIGRRGHLEVWPLAIKPGKPVGFGDIDDCPILALPGNSVAAAITFIAFGKPIIDHLAGATQPASEMLFLPSAFEFTKQKGVRQFVLAKASPQASGSQLLAIADQGPAMLSALSSTGGIIVLEEDREAVMIGDILAFMPLAAFLH